MEPCIIVMFYSHFTFLSLLHQTITVNKFCRCHWDDALKYLGESVTAYRMTALCMASSLCYTLCSPHAQIVSGSCMPFEWESYLVTVHVHSSLLTWCHWACANISWCHFAHHSPKGIKQCSYVGAGFFLPRGTGKGRSKLPLRIWCALPARRFWNVTLKGKCLVFLYAIMQAASTWMGCPLI